MIDAPNAESPEIKIPLANTEPELCDICLKPLPLIGGVWKIAKTDTVYKPAHVRTKILCPRCEAWNERTWRKE